MVDWGQIREGLLQRLYSRVVTLQLKRQQYLLESQLKASVMGRPSGVWGQHQGRAQEISILRRARWICCRWSGDHHLRPSLEVLSGTVEVLREGQR